MNKIISSWLSNEPFAFLTSDILTFRIAWTIRLRWLAVAGYLLGTIIAKNFSSIILPYEKMWIALACLAFINLVYSISSRWLKRLSFRGEIFVLQIQIIIDLIILTILVHYAGGIGNPIYLFYVFHVVLSSIIFPGLIPILYATFTIFSFFSLIFLEYNGYLNHYCLFPVCNHDSSEYIYLVLLVFTITVYVTAYICMVFMRTYRNIKKQIDRKNRELIESDRQKTKFFRFASHELKSPVIAIKSSIDSFIRNYGENVDERGINLIKRAAMRSTQMLDITQELLELSKNRALIRKRKMEKVNIPQLLKEIILQESINIKEKNQKLQDEISTKIPPIIAEKNDLVKIFRNLINNTIRYTPENGKIEINARTHRRNLVFMVKDTGIGVSKEDSENIFREFYRSENAKKMVNYGTGLGLTLVKQLIENYGGKIEITSEINKGTTFTVILPLKQGGGSID